MERSIRTLTRRFRRFNPETGEFNVERTARAYAALLGVSPALLVKLERRADLRPVLIIEGIARLIHNHPHLWHELIEALVSERDTLREAA